MDTNRSALVVYESMFGNTREIARAIAEGLSSHAEVEIHDVGSAPDPTGFDLVVVGAPTHAFSLSRASTRADAAKQGATGPTETGLREWLDALPSSAGSPPFVTFDTRAQKVRMLPGSAARKAERMLEAKGYPVLDHVTFWVLDTSGPLIHDKRRRARAWAEWLAPQITSRGATTPGPNN